MEEPSASAPSWPLIKVVGISASGKSTLVKKLRNAGYEARPVSQEHSDVPDLWQQFGRPAILIYLEVSLEAQRERRPDVNWDARYLQTERLRLAHARDHAQLKINTSAIEPDIVWKIAKVFLERERIPHADHPLSGGKVTGSALLTTDVEDLEQPKTAESAQQPKHKRKRKKRSAL